jgi:predicted permease
MKLLSTLRTVAGTLFRRSRIERDMDEELRSHIANRTNDLMRSAGLSRAEAERRARIEFGGYQKYKEEIRESLGAHFIETLLQDIRYAFRMLRKSPGFTAVAVLTLALGIGANTAIFSVVDAVLLRSLPVKDPQQLVVLSWSARQKPKYTGHSGYGDCDSEYRRGGKRDCSFSVPFFDAIRTRTGDFSGMAAFAGPLGIDFSGNGPATMAKGTWVSGDFFSTLGVDTILGRPLGPSDDSPSAPPVIVLSYACWQRAFGADRSVIGRAVRLNSVPATIIGVADPHFTNVTPGKTQDFFMPLALCDRVRSQWWGDVDRLSDATSWWIVIIGRLKPGIVAGQAQAAATTVFRNELFHGSKPLSTPADAPTISLMSAREGLNGETGEIAPMLFLLMFGVGFILLIACANVAGLTLARSATRQKEMSVRLALGAARTRLIRQLLTESVLLSLIGGALGIFVAFWGVRAIVALFGTGYSDFPFVIAPDWRVLTFTLAVVLATGILFGLAPALRGTRVDLTPALKESASSLPRAAVRTKRFSRLGDALVITQVSLSAVVLIGAGLFLRTVRNLHSLNPGFDTRNILLFEIDPTIAGYTDPQTQQLYSNLQQRFAAMPGVLSVSYSEDALVDGGWSGDDFHLDGTPPKSIINPATLSVGLNFFSTMRIPVLAGRAFTPADFVAAASTRAARKAASSPPVPVVGSVSPANASSVGGPKSLATIYAHSTPIPIMVNEMFAQKFFSNQNPVGKHFGDAQYIDGEAQLPSPGYTIIGVAANTKYKTIRQPIVPTVFLPLVSNSAYFELRAAGNPTALVKNVRDIVSRAADNLPLTNVRTQTEQIDQTLFLERLLSRLSSFFGALALVLACIGLYGLLAYEVARRTREIGIRMALGAQQRDLLRLVVGQGILLAFIGVAIGIAAALGVTRFISSMLFGVRANDPLTIIAVAILLGLVALLACYIPARRAVKVDPVVALRYE